MPGPGTVANPYETIEPKDGTEALEYATRYMAQIMPRAQVIHQVTVMGANRVIDAVSGRTVEPPLSPVETHLATTVDHYRSLMGSPVGAVALLECLRQDVLDGGVFVGEPLPESHFA